MILDAFLMVALTLADVSFDDIIVGITLVYARDVWEINKELSCKHFLLREDYFFVAIRSWYQKSSKSVLSRRCNITFSTY